MSKAALRVCTARSTHSYLVEKSNVEGMSYTWPFGMSSRAWAIKPEPVATMEMVETSTPFAFSLSTSSVAAPARELHTQCGV